MSKLLQDVDNLQSKGDKDIKGFVKAGLGYFEAAVRKIINSKYVGAVKDLTKLTEETNRLLEVSTGKVFHISGSCI